MKKVVVVVLAVILCVACESKPTTETVNVPTNSETQESIVVAAASVAVPKIQEVKKPNPCDPQLLTRKVEVRELKLKELRKINFGRYNVDDDNEPNYEDYTELTYGWDIVGINSKKARTKKTIPEILAYYWQRGEKDIFKKSEKQTYHKLFIEDILGEFESIAYQEKIFNQVMNSPEALAADALTLLKTIPNGKKLALDWGKWFIERYKNLDWDAEVGILIKRTSVFRQGKDDEYCGWESDTNVLKNLHPARRDTQGRFVNESLKECVRDNYSNWRSPDEYFCPVMLFANEKYENDWTMMDKQVWRAGPKFYTNAVKIIRIVWNELDIEP